MKAKGSVWICVFGLFAFGAVLHPGAAAEKAAPGRIECDLTEVSVFQLDERNLLRGQRVECGTQPCEEVRAYPKLASKRPLYGVAEFDKSYYSRKPGLKFAFVIDESAGTGNGYDRLVFDLNRDGDLTNDSPVGVLRDTPEVAMIPYKLKQAVCFNCLDVPFDFGKKDGTRTLRVLPRVMEWEGGSTAMYFLATSARKGRIAIGKRRYEVVLAQAHTITGRFDRRETRLELTDVTGGGLRRHGWWGSDKLSHMRPIDGTWYRFSATPTGSKFFAEPHRGELGLLKVGAGGRKVDKLAMCGSLSAPDRAVPVGDLSVPSSEGRVRETSMWPKDVQEMLLPVGDYFPAYITCQLGRLKINVSNNYHSDGKPRSRTGLPPVCGIRIRKGKPFVLDFSNEPVVLFASPAEGARFKAGQEVKVAAVLVDPVLDVMIRGLEDTSRKVKVEREDRGGRKYSYETSLSLDPKVVVTDPSGKRVAEGVLPFG